MSFFRHFPKTRDSDITGSPSPWVIPIARLCTDRHTVCHAI